jgi:hypothetical protein
MKKLRQRKGLVALMLAAAALSFVGGSYAWRGITHHGPGFWTFGGDAPESSGSSGTEEHTEETPENEYKRQCYGGAGIFLLFAGMILWEVVKKWRERDELEKSWEQTISVWMKHPDGLQSMQERPELYRDDFKQWIKENHPEFHI